MYVCTYVSPSSKTAIHALLRHVFIPRPDELNPGSQFSIFLHFLSVSFFPAPSKLFLAQRQIQQSLIKSLSLSLLYLSSSPLLKAWSVHGQLALGSLKGPNSKDGVLASFVAKDQTNEMTVGHAPPFSSLFSRYIDPTRAPCDDLNISGGILYVCVRVYICRTDWLASIPCCCGCSDPRNCGFFSALSFTLQLEEQSAAWDKIQSLNSMAFVFFSPSPSLSRDVDILCQPTHTTMHKEISTTDSDSSSSLSVLFSVFDRCMTNCVPHREEALAQTGFGSHKKCAHQIALFHTRKCNRQICIDRRKRKLHHSSSILSNFIITG